MRSNKSYQITDDVENAAATGQLRKPRKHSRGWWLLLLIPAGLLTAFISYGATQQNSSGGMHPAHPPPAASQIPAQPPSSPPAQAAPIGAVGDSLTVRQNGQDAADVTITKVSVTTRPYDPYGEKPRHGYYMTAHVHVAVRSGFTEGFEVNPMDFHGKIGTAQFDQGNGNSMPNAPGNNRNLFPTTVAAGKTMDGTIVFDVPAPHGFIVYAPNFDGQPLAEWRY
jgi:hypothetical protein